MCVPFLPINWPTKLQQSRAAVAAAAAYISCMQDLGRFDCLTSLVIIRFLAKIGLVMFGKVVVSIDTKHVGATE